MNTNISSKFLAVHMKILVSDRHSNSHSSYVLASQKWWWVFRVSMFTRVQTWWQRRPSIICISILDQSSLQEKSAIKEEIEELSSYEGV